MLLSVFTLISAVSFLIYGSSFFATAGMKEEFERYGLDAYRKLIGLLQLLGGAGLLIGLLYLPILIISSAGLCLLMMIGFVVRLKMKDGFFPSMPSFIFMLLNGYICFAAFCR
jgi:uncharacterized membrane protein YphA (DoxX/SURF4 family)